MYLQDKRYADAEKILRRAEDKKLDSQSNERLKIQLAAVYERQKDFDRAESLFKEILKANPKNAVALNYIGYMLADRGRPARGSRPVCQGSAGYRSAKRRLSRFSRLGILQAERPGECRKISPAGR